MTAHPRRILLFALIAFLVVAVLYLGIGVGPGWSELGSWLTGGADKFDSYIFSSIRLPRLLVGAFAGASLALAGTVMQATFRNPLAAPDVIGTSAGAAFGGALAIVSNLADYGVLAVPFASFAGAAAATALVFLLAGSHGRFSVTSLLLAGIALNTLIGALTSFVVTFTFDNYSASSQVLFWLMGGLDRASWQSALITALGFALFALCIAPRARVLDLLTLNDDSAHSLGIDGPRARRWFLWCACGLTATTVSNTGGIAFVGLVVPHLARLIVGPAHRALLPVSAAIGALLLVVSDLVCLAAPADANLRLSVVTAVLGAPYFLYLLARHRRGEAL